MINNQIKGIVVPQSLWITLDQFSNYKRLFSENNKFKS